MRMDDSHDRATAPERIAAPDIPLAFTSSDFRVSLLPLERVALYLAAALFFVITAVLFTIIVDWMIHRPSEPTISGLKLDEQKLAIENFKLMSDVVWDRTSRTFDLIVIKALLPVFATIVGYLLGKRS
jgi:hypothetical protein